MSWKLTRTRPGIGDLYAKANQLPTLDLAFGDTQSLTDQISGKNLITYTRPSAATYFDRNGVLRTAAPNEPRFQYDAATGRFGYLHEPAATNLCLSSYYTANTNGWTNGVIGGVGTIAAASETNLVGTTANVFNVSGLNASSYVGCLLTTASSSNAYTGSIYAKNNGGTVLQLRLVHQTGGTFKSTGAQYTWATGAWQDGVAGTQSPIARTAEAIGNGWFRFTITSADNNSGNTQTALLLFGGGTTTNHNYFIWHSQLETGTVATSPIVTAGSAVTRAADVMTITGSNFGTVVEPSITNWIRNNSGVGAVVGTPGTLPTNWGHPGAAALTAAVIGVGTESGIPYVEMRFNGTAVGTGHRLAFESTTQIAAANGQTWTASAYIALTAGSLAGVTTQVRFTERTSGGAFVAHGMHTAVVPSIGTALSLCRFSGTRTLAGGGTVGVVVPEVEFTVADGATYDFTLRIGLPQLEQNATATAPIVTSGSAVTRPGIVNSTWYDQAGGCWYAEINRSAPVVGTYPQIVGLDAGTAANGYSIYSLDYASRYTYGASVGTVGQVAFNQSADSAPNVHHKLAMRLVANDGVLAVNGALTGADNSITMPTVSRTNIGSNPLGNLLIHRLAYFPPGPAQTRLQQLTS